MYKSPEKLALKKELQDLKDNGEAPQFLTWIGYQKLKGGYLIGNETPKDMYVRVARAAASYLPKDKKKWEKKFFNLFWKNWLAGSTPVLGNLGTNRGMAVSCSAQYCGDTLEEILGASFESGMLSKYGFGTAIYLDLRDGYSPIATGGHSNNVKDWVEQNWFIQNKVTQSNLRRGSTAQYLDFWHGDLFDILPMLETHDRLHLGIICDDSVKEALQSGDEEAWKRYRTILNWRARKGKPYIIFIDNAKRQDPECYKKLGLETKQSNLCIAGDQRVVSNRGYLTAQELYEQGGDLILFDGNRPIEATPMKLRKNSQQIYKVTLKNGLTHRVTANHGMAKIIDNKIVRTETKDLLVGDKIAIQTNKGIFGSRRMEDEAFLLGLYQADGTQYQDIRMIDLWENDFDLIPEIEQRFAAIHEKYGCDTYKVNLPHKSVTVIRSCSPAKFTSCSKAGVSNVKKKRLASKTFVKAELAFNKAIVPQWIWESDEATVWQYLRGLLYADGTIYVGKPNQNNKMMPPINLSLTNTSREFLQDLQLLINNLGLQSSLHLQRNGGYHDMPDGKGGLIKSLCKTTWRLVIGSRNDCLTINRHTGFLDRKGIKLEDRIYRDNTRKSYEIISIEEDGVEDVYCPTTHTDEHIFTSNGLLTFNCTEIFLHTDSEHTLSCVLSSMNCTTYDEWKDTDAVKDAIVFLDCVAEDLIQRGKGIRGLEKVVRHTMKGRALGLGLLGFHTYLQQNMLSMDSLQARGENHRIFKHIKEQAEEATKFLADWLGEPEWCKGSGRRNTHMLAIAPNTSSALIAGSVSQGIEPNVANVFTQKVAKGTIDRINPVLLKLLREKGKYTDEVIDSIAYNKGSVQHLDFLTQEEKDVFRTAYEISQKLLVDLADQRQRWICQGQSLNLFFAADEDEQWIHEVHKHAFEKEWLKSLYYVRTMPGITADKSDCSACEG